jgi:hypothetical protein
MRCSSKVLRSAPRLLPTPHTALQPSCVPSPFSTPLARRCGGDGLWSPLCACMHACMHARTSCSKKGNPSHDAAAAAADGLQARQDHLCRHARLWGGADGAGVGQQRAHHHEGVLEEELRGWGGGRGEEGAEGRAGSCGLRCVQGGITLFMAAAACDGAWEQPTYTGLVLFPSGSLSHTRTGSISAVDVGWVQQGFTHRFQPP